MSQEKKKLFLMYQRQIKQKKNKINKNLLIFLKNIESKKKSNLY